MEIGRPNAAIHQISAYVLYCFVRPGGYGQFWRALPSRNIIFRKNTKIHKTSVVLEENYDFHEIPNIPRNVRNINIPLGLPMVQEVLSMPNRKMYRKS